MSKIPFGNIEMENMYNIISKELNELYDKYDKMKPEEVEKELSTLGVTSITEYFDKKHFPMRRKHNTEDEKH